MHDGVQLNDTECNGGLNQTWRDAFWHSFKIRCGLVHEPQRAACLLARRLREIDFATRRQFTPDVGDRTADRDTACQSNGQRRTERAAGARDHFGAGNKNIAPVVVDGRVFVATTNSVAVFGLLP